MSGIFENSKEFVDMKCKNSPDKTLKEYEKFEKKYKNKKPTKSQIQSFVSNNFDAVGSEYEEWSPPDFKSNPRLLKKIASSTYKTWASDLNKLWKKLGRKQKKDVTKHPDRYSFVSLPNPVILPSNEAREFTYWDNYWTIQGLLACDMFDVS